MAEALTPKNAYTCKRRKDYITGIGVVLFFCIVVFEFYLVFVLPSYIRSEGVLEGEVAKQEMINLADKLRNELRDVNAAGKLQNGEVNMASSALDGLASYIRENQERMSKAQIRDTYSLLQSYATLAQNWKDGKFLVKEESLDCSKYIDSIEAKAGVKPPAASGN